MNDRSDQGSNEEFVHMRNLLDQSLASAIDESCYHTGGILQEAMRYAVMSGGKRIRPILTIAVYQLFHRDSKTEHCLPHVRLNSCIPPR